MKCHRCQRSFDQIDRTPVVVGGYVGTPATPRSFNEVYNYCERCFKDWQYFNRMFNSYAVDFELYRMMKD